MAATRRKELGCHRNLVGELAVGRLAASFEPKQPTANQILMKIELKTKNLHFRANLLCTPLNRILGNLLIFLY
jgi:hypothetical protein